MNDAFAASAPRGALDLRRAAAGAVCGAGLVALGLLVWEVFAVASAGWRTCVAVGAAMLVLATVAALIAAAVVLLVRSVLRGLEHIGVDWSLVLLAMVGASFAVLGAQDVVLRVLNGEGIRAAAVALSAALGVGLAAAVIAVVRTARPRARRWVTSVQLRAAITVAALLALGLALVALAPGLVDELDVRGLVSAGAPLLGGLIGGLLGVGSRGLLRVAAGVWLLFAIAGVTHAAVPAPTRVGFALQRSTHAARLFFDLSGASASGELELAPMVHAGTCHPGVAPGPIVGRRRAPEDAPDIVLITAEAFRWDHTSLAGYRRDTTPRLSEHGRSAAVFSSAHTPASSTRQTLRALLSGLLPSQVPPSRGDGPWALSFQPGQRTLAAYLRDAGYRTMTDSMGGEALTAKYGGMQGFEKRLRGETIRGSRGDRRGGRVKAQLRGVLETVSAERSSPRFMWTHLAVTHQPYSTGQKSPYGKAIMDRYDGAIHFLDEQLGVLFDGLNAGHHLEHTYVILTADHGQAFREHGHKDHGHSVYQEETHVPLLIWGPDVSAGRRSAPVSVLDVFPTILDMARLGSVPAACGESLLPQLRDAKAPLDRDVYMEQIPDTNAYFSIGFIRGKYKLVVSPRSGVRELFDLRADPGELNDLSEERPDVAASMTKALTEFQLARGLDPASYGLP